MKPSCLILLALLAPAACAQPARPNLYQCEGCEALHEHPAGALSWQTTIPPAGEPGQRLVLTGTVYQADGTKPAAGVVLYAYHTNAAGHYPTRGTETGWSRRHGYLRGWVKTDAQGRYRFDTIRPGPYPGRPDPAHIHLVVKEPSHPPYWIEEVVFEGDPRLQAKSLPADPRGGPGLVGLTRDRHGVWHGRRDILLEVHPEVP